MKWSVPWMKLFGTTQLPGADMDLWVAVAITALIVAVMNIVFCGMKPKGSRKTHV